MYQNGPGDWEVLMWPREGYMEENIVLPLVCMASVWKLDAPSRTMRKQVFAGSNKWNQTRGKMRHIPSLMRRACQNLP